MSKKTKLCPFRKVVERETDSMTGKTVERERFQPCIRHKCMAYVYLPPVITVSKDKSGIVAIDDDNPDNWGCARVLNGG